MPSIGVPCGAGTYCSVFSLCTRGGGSDLERLASSHRSARTEPESSVRGSPNAPEGTIRAACTHPQVIVHRAGRDRERGRQGRRVGGRVCDH
eukprot:scaffold162396_cov32-Tisochrysis_lutea.AAC.1